MANFFKGIVLLMLGLIAWVVLSVVGAANEVVTGERNEVLFGLVMASFLVMILGPVLFWVVAPVVGFWRRQRARRGLAAAVTEATAPRRS